MSIKPNSWKDKASTLSQVDKPLKFFALSLLIVEALIGILSVRASSEFLFSLLVAGTTMFVLVVLMVVLIIFKKPEWLTAEKPSDALRFIEIKKEQVTKQIAEESPDMRHLQKIFDDVNTPIDKLGKLELSKEKMNMIRNHLEILSGLELLEKDLNPKYKIDMHRQLEKARFYFVSDDHVKAINVVDDILKKEPNNQDAQFLGSSIMFGLGRKARKRKNIEEAISNYHKSVKYDENYLPSIYNIACNESIMGNKDESLIYLKKVVHKNSNKYKKLAKEDLDFKTLWDDPDFKDLTN